jgi:hypothetical protein
LKKKDFSEEARVRNLAPEIGQSAKGIGFFSQNVMRSKRSSRELVLGNEIDELTRKPLADLVTGAGYPEGRMIGRQGVHGVT